MKAVSSRAALLAAAKIIPVDRFCKNAASIETLLESHADSVAKAIEGVDQKAETLRLEVNELMQNFDSRSFGGKAETESWGQQFIKCPQLKDFSEDRTRPGRLRLELKTVLTTDGTSAGSLGGQAYHDEPSNIPRRPLRVRDLIPSVPITTGAFEYPKQTTRTNNAAPTGETLAMPESALGWTMQSGTPKVIGHWIPASRQILDDAQQLMGLIDTELRYGLSLVEDSQLLNGSGTGENLTGLVTNATAFVAPAGFASAGMVDDVGLAILQATISDFNPTGIVMHPADWMRMKMLKDGEGRYLLSDPITGKVGRDNQMAPMLHGLPIALTTSMAQGKFLVGDFTVAATIYDRWAPTVEVSTEHSDFFTRNMIAIRATERLGLAIKQAGALIYGDFGYL